MRAPGLSGSKAASHVIPQMGRRRSVRPSRAFSEKRKPSCATDRNGQIAVDEAFIRQTLLHPEIDRVKGFPPIMPSQKGVLTDHEIDTITEHLKSLK